MQLETEDTLQLPQKLSAMLIQLNALQTLAEEVALSPFSEVQSMRRGLEVLDQMLRTLLYEVRSSNDDLPFLELGTTLSEALSRLVEETAQQGGFSSHISFSGAEHPLPNVVEHLLYLIAQEVLYQVQQHTATRKLRLTFTYERDAAQMNIEDDGRLPSPPEDDPMPLFTAEGALPLLASLSSSSNTAIFSDLRQRLEHLGGSLEMSIGTGNIWVQARIPYDVRTQAAVPSMPAPLASSSAEAQFSAPSTEQIRVLVVDSQAVTRAGLRYLLTSYADLQVVGEAADGVQAVSETLELGPQVVLMDMQLPNGQSLEALRQIKQLNLDTRVLLLSVKASENYLYEALRMGADGYVLKDIAPDELAQALRAVAHGEVLVRVPGRGISPSGRAPSRSGSLSHVYEALTTREQEVLHLLARGLRNKEMAARLYVSERTVNFHLANIYQKLNVSGRTEALSKALEQGLLTL